MTSRRRRVSRAIARNRLDIALWAASALLVVAALAATLATGVPWFGVGATVMVGLLRLGVEIGKRERVAGVREELGGRATEGVAGAANRHLLKRTIWQNEDAYRAAWLALLVEKTDKLMPHIDTWTLAEIVERGEEPFDLRDRAAGDWLAISGELVKAHDDFAAAVGPYTADLSDEQRHYITAALAGLEHAKKSSDEAFRLLYRPGDSTNEEIDAGARGLYKDLQFVYSAAVRLGASE